MKKKTFNSKPTSPGRRGKVNILFDLLSKSKKEKSLIGKIKKRKGRNNKGRITVRHRGGGVKKKYRIIDFKREKRILGKIESIEKDPNRNCFISKVLYKDGERRYIIHIKNIKVDDNILSGPNVKNKIGNFKKISNIPIGTKICCLEISPGGGAKILRSAGAYGTIIAKKEKYCVIKLKSEVRKFNINCYATIGEVGNEEFHLIKKGKAGYNRIVGIRPTVRGVAMNPIDHPHGGGEGKTSAGRHPVSPWGILTKGFKTRKNKRTSNMILKKNEKI